MLRQPQHNAERELCHDIEFYCLNKCCEELQKECRDRGHNQELKAKIFFMTIGSYSKTIATQLKQKS